eukprot:scaffold2696_cov104-Cylindrotheca_fusiformis.AAC.2
MKWNPSQGETASHMKCAGQDAGRCGQLPLSMLFEKSARALESNSKTTGTLCERFSETHSTSTTNEGKSLGTLKWF